MANANISLVTVSNTFDEWRIGTNDLVEDRNILRNAHYVKDAGDFELANSVMRVNKADGGTALIVTGNSGANIVVAGTVVSGNLLVSQNATVGNLTITGNQIIQGSVLNDANLFVLRANSSSDDTSTIRSKRFGTTNAELRFFHTSNVWQVSANASAGHSTILTAANVVDSTFSTSLLTVPTSNALKGTYDLALATFAESQTGANTVRVSANSGSTQDRKQLNFINTSSVTVSVTSGTTGNANIAFSVTGSAQGATGPQGATGAGSQGSTGPQGASGSAGPGSQGPQGASGAGSQGANGNQGATGAGPQGSSGAQGASGSAGTINDETASSSTHYPVLSTTTSGTLSGVQVSSTKLYFQPSTGTLSATDFAVVSDQRLKDIHGDITDATDKVINLSTVEYTWNETAKTLGFSEDTRVQVGLIAQELEGIYDTLVHKGDDGYLRVNYDKVVPILVQAIKELNERVKKLESK